MIAYCVPGLWHFKHREVRVRESRLSILKNLVVLFLKRGMLAAFMFGSGARYPCFAFDCVIAFCV